MKRKLPFARFAEWFDALRGNPTPGEDDVATIEKKVKATTQDCLKLEEDVRIRDAQISTMRKSIRAAQDEKMNLCKEDEVLKRKIEEMEAECQELKNKSKIAEIEKITFEREMATANFYSMLSQRVELTCRTGEDFLLHVSVQQPKEELQYPDVVRAAKDFLVPDVPPAITEDARAIEWAFPGNRRGRVVVVDEFAAKNCSGRLFFVGDIHGDVDALRRIIEQIFRRDGKSILVFLGDLFDRGDKSIDAIRLLVWTARTFPGQVLWIAGNHDIGFHFDEGTQQFTSHVQPSEFSEWMNRHQAAKDEGILLLNVIRTLPVACVIGNVWASHGGVPQSDISGEFSAFDKMSEEMESDCVWSRMKDAPAKLPNRSHLGAEVGRKDASAFFERVKEREHVCVRHMVCAHQHEQRNGAGCVQFSRHFNPDELSCQCLFSFHDREHDVKPCYLEYVHGKVPVPHTI